LVRHDSKNDAYDDANEGDNVANAEHNNPPMDFGSGLAALCRVWSSQLF
jgi:hypothetical protein